MTDDHTTYEEKQRRLAEERRKRNAKVRRQFNLTRGGARSGTEERERREQLARIKAALQRINRMMEDIRDVHLPEGGNSEHGIEERTGRTGIHVVTPTDSSDPGVDGEG